MFGSLFAATSTASAATKAPPKAPGATSAQTKAGATAWVRVFTPVKMKPLRKLRYRIYCRVACSLAVTTKLKWPGRRNLVSTIRGTFKAGESRANILTLNQPAVNTLKANWRQTVMEIVVRARNRETGASHTVRKFLRFQP